MENDQQRIADSIATKPQLISRLPYYAKAVGVVSVSGHKGAEVDTIPNWFPEHSEILKSNQTEEYIPKHYYFKIVDTLLFYGHLRKLSIINRDGHIRHLILNPDDILEIDVCKMVISKRPLSMQISN